MLRRRALVIVMLAALLAAGLVGVFLMFAPFTPESARLIASALTVVVASAMLLPLSQPSGDRRPSLAATVWLVFVAAGALLVLGSIWTLQPRAQNPNTVQVLAASWISYGLPTAAVLLAALRQSRTVAKARCLASVRMAVAGTAAAFGTAVLLQMGAIQGSTSLGRNMFVPVAFCIVIGGVLVASAALTAFRTPRDQGAGASFNRICGAFGLLATLVATTGWVAIVGDEFDLWRLRILTGRGDLERLLVAGLVASSGVALSSAIWCPLANLGFRSWARVLPASAALLTLLMTALLASAVAFREIVAGNQALLERGLGALAILDACVLLSVAVITRARRAVAPTDEAMRAVTGLEIKCPRCGTPRFAGPGESGCPECRLVLIVSFRDDFCPSCRYDLRGMTEGVCPECGRARQVPTGA